MEEQKQEKKIPKKKLEQIERLVELIKNSNTIMVVSIKNLPSRQFQNIRKELKGKAEVVVAKKRALKKAIEESKQEGTEKLKDYLREDTAMLFSRQDAFELATWLAENKSPIKAKPGQIAEENVEVEEGATDLVPGPAISELGNLGIKIAVEEGKIAIKENKVIVKAGEKINGAAASIMTKLDIVPFEIGLEPIAIYDKNAEKIYVDVKINKKKTVEEMKASAMKALGLAQKIVYYCKDTIGYLLAKANADENALKKLIPEEKPQSEDKISEKSEEKNENTENKKEETKKSETESEKNQSQEDKQKGEKKNE